MQYLYPPTKLLKQAPSVALITDRINAVVFPDDQGTAPAADLGRGRLKLRVLAGIRRV